MPKIDDVSFGKLTANGKVYRAPLIAFRDRIDGRWWRADGMTFGPKDFDSVLDAEPDVVVLGVGIAGTVSVPDETRQRFSDAGIELVVEDTPTAVETYNRLLVDSNVVGAFHLM